MHRSPKTLRIESIFFFFKEVQGLFLTLKLEKPETGMLSNIPVCAEWHSVMDNREVVIVDVLFCTKA